MNKTKSALIFIPAAVLMLAACNKSAENPAPTPVVLPGGKGGTHHIAVFPKYNAKGVAGRVFLKYGATMAPTFNDTSAYDEVFSTMTEPGYGPHAHFDLLKEGYYYVYAVCSSSTAGTVKGGMKIQLKKDDPAAIDMDLIIP